MIIKYIGKKPFEDEQKRFVLNNGDHVDLGDKEASDLLKKKDKFTRGDEDVVSRDVRSGIQE